MISLARGLFLRLSSLFILSSLRSTTFRGVKRCELHKEPSILPLLLQLAQITPMFRLRSGKAGRRHGVTTPHVIPPPEHERPKARRLHYLLKSSSHCSLDLHIHELPQPELLAPEPSKFKSQITRSNGLLVSKISFKISIFAIYIKNHCFRAHSLEARVTKGS